MRYGKTSIFVLSAIDGILSAIGFQSGFLIEINPWLRFCYENYGVSGFALVKTLLIIAMLSLFRLVEKLDTDHAYNKTFRRVYIFLTMFYALLAIYYTFVYSRHYFYLNN
ncbi:MAG: DUF5658 family protein [Candidatus Paceibacterota bacterium]|jgi:hypothetical protein